MCYVIDCYIGMIINKSLVAGLRCGGWAGRGPSPLDTLPAALSTLPTFCIPPDTETPPSPPPHSDEQIANWRLLLQHSASKIWRGKGHFEPPCALHPAHCTTCCLLELVSALQSSHINIYPTLYFIHNMQAAGAAAMNALPSPILFVKLCLYKY